MSAKTKTAAGMTPPASSPDETAMRAATVAAALESVYGDLAEPPFVRYPLPLGTLSAGAASQVAELMTRVSLPARMALVCELTLPTHPGGLPELVVAVPEALLVPFQRLAQAAGNVMGTPQRGPEAGLAMALGACGRARLATLQTKPPAVLATTNGGKAQPPELSEVISETLGLLRMAEKCSSDPDWIFGQHSPVWLLFLSVGNRLEEAYKAETETKWRKREAMQKSPAVQVVETGAVVSPAWEGAES